MKLFMLAKNKKGFTLLECVVSIAIIGIVCSSILALFSQGMIYINKAKKLDTQAGKAEKTVILNKTTSSGVDTQGNFENYVSEVKVDIQFTINYGAYEKRELASYEYVFSAGLSTNNGASTKVVYYDISSKELVDLR